MDGMHFHMQRDAVHATLLRGTRQKCFNEGQLLRGNGYSGGDQTKGVQHPLPIGLERPF